MDLKEIYRSNSRAIWFIETTIGEEKKVGTGFSLYGKIMTCSRVLVGKHARIKVRNLEEHTAYYMDVDRRCKERDLMMLKFQAEEDRVKFQDVVCSTGFNSGELDVFEKLVSFANPEKILGMCCRGHVAEPIRHTTNMNIVQLAGFRNATYGAWGGPVFKADTGEIVGMLFGYDDYVCTAAHISTIILFANEKAEDHIKQKNYTISLDDDDDDDDEEEEEEEEVTSSCPLKRLETAVDDAPGNKSGNSETKLL